MNASTHSTTGAARATYTSAGGGIDEASVGIAYSERRPSVASAISARTAAEPHAIQKCVTGGHAATPAGLGQGGD